MLWKAGGVIYSCPRWDLPMEWGTSYLWFNMLPGALSLASCPSRLSLVLKSFEFLTLEKWGNGKAGQWKSTFSPSSLIWNLKHVRSFCFQLGWRKCTNGHSHGNKKNPGKIIIKLFCGGKPSRCKKVLMNFREKQILHMWAKTWDNFHS